MRDSDPGMVFVWAAGMAVIYIFIGLMWWAVYG